MVTPIRIQYDNKADGVTPVLSTATENANFPLANLQHQFKTKTFRTDVDQASPLDGEVTWDMGSAIQINAIAIINHNLDSGGTYKLQGNATDSWGSPTVDETITHNSGMMLKYITGDTLRYWRLDIAKSTDTFIEMGRVFLVSYYQPARQYNTRWSQTPVDSSRQSSSEGLQIHSDEQDMHDLLALTFNQISDAEKYNNLLPFLNNVKKSKSFVISLDIDNYLSELSFYVKIDRMPPIQHQIVGLHNFNIVFREML